MPGRCTPWPTDRGAPVWSSAADADALEGKAPVPTPNPDSVMDKLFSGWWKDKHPVARRLSEGERIGDFEVIAFPGHTPGHDRALARVRPHGGVRGHDAHA